MPGPFPTIQSTVAVVASPALAAETIIAQLNGVTLDSPSRHVDLSGWAAFTVGTTGTAVRLRIRQKDLTGNVVADSGALTGGIAAAGLVAQDVEGQDQPGDVAAFTYVLTLQVTGGSAVSTVTATKLRAIISA